jgi:hypothetical protein
LVEVLKPLLDVFDGKVHGMVLWGTKRVVASVYVEKMMCHSNYDTSSMTYLLDKITSKRE